MIIRWPDMPQVDGRLSIPRPSIFLLGSYTLSQSAGDWYEQAARYLERHAGMVVYGIMSGDGWREEFFTWYYHWLDRADVVAVWIESPTWSQFELGVVLGSHARSGKPALVLGVDGRLERLRRALELVMEHFGLALPIHNDRAATIHAARDRLRGFR